MNLGEDARSEVLPVTLWCSLLYGRNGVTSTDQGPSAPESPVEEVSFGSIFFYIFSVLGYLFPLGYGVSYCKSKLKSVTQLFYLIQTFFLN